MKKVKKPVVKKKTTKKKKISKLFKKMNGTSNLEVSFAQLLTDLGFNFEQHFMFKKREYDFLLTDFNILIETHGCFFHCCKTHNSVAVYPFQRRNIKNDKLKSKNVKFDPNYRLLVVWEHEMKDKTLLTEKINKFVNKNILKG
jgi:G:T-mismatch repair DNA endonuclease (very short patch repair protein)